MRFYQGKKLLITGGSSGIGRSAALLAASWGADVAIVARGRERLDATLEELRKVGDGRYIALALDVSDRAAIERAVPQILEELGGLDVLVNNAGLAHPGYIGEIPHDVFDLMMNVNYHGAVNVTRAFLPHFEAQRSGNICNVSSVLGFMGVFGYTAYAASKFALTGFSECLRQELVHQNVGVTVVYPPDTDTPQFHAENEIKPAETKMLSGTIKVMQPDQVARIMLDGIARNRLHVVPGSGSKFIYFMNQHFPSVVRWFIDSDLRKFAKNDVA